MSEAGNIYWLASYPKSGNTWVRAFIANLRHEKPTPVDINELGDGAIASGRYWVETALDFDINELSHDEIDLLRPSAYRWLSQQLTHPEYHKIHDAYTCLPNNEPLIPFDATKGVLYIIRNPLDVAISFAHHSGCSIDKSIEYMNNKNFALCSKTNRIDKQLRQRLLCWSAHVMSWIEASELKRLVVRYEDMKAHPVKTFTKIAVFLEQSNDEKKILAALQNCQFEKLQRQEENATFNERNVKSDAFFRKGIVGDWENTLTEIQVETIVKAHYPVMQQFGYLDGKGQPVRKLRKTPMVCQSLK